jgi:hypothetical protein
MTSTPVTLMLTHSIDYVADLIVEKLGTERVFRYNSDMWEHYKLRVTDNVIELENAAGRRITDADVAKVYYRSNHRASEVDSSRALSAEDRYMEVEVWSAWNDILSIFYAARKVVLIHPYAMHRLGKMQQLRLAGNYFVTTPYSFLINRPDALRPGVESVAKSFGFRYGADAVFCSNKVWEDQLDPRCPWFLTDLVTAEADVTVAFVRDELFAFSLDRRSFVDGTIDWRLAPGENALRNWKPITLSPSFSEKIFAFMMEAGAHYGRLDFLHDGGKYVFLEVNFTGEWGWLDPEGQHGLRDKILREIDPMTPCISCPVFEPARP